MAEPHLLAEITEIVSSAQEARWIVEELGGEPDEARAIALRRRQGEPLQYLLGSWPFRSIELLVDSRALIPRPETEQVVGVALAELAARGRGDGTPVVVDLGAGTGAIGLSAASELAAEGTVVDLVLVDRSPAALALARENAERLGISARLELGTWHEGIPAELVGRVDLLISNPPYIDLAMAPTLAAELSHEPPEALFSAAGPDGIPGMADVAVVIAGAPASLAPGGILVVEMGEGQVAPAVELAAAAGLAEARAFEDLAGHPRGIVAVRP